MRYVVTHKLPPGTTRDDITRIAKESQGDANVKGLRSFINLTECRAVCVLDASDKDTLASWFRDKGVTYDNIFEVELEGELGKFVEVPMEVGAGTGI